jgi:hypothetical protein
MPSRYVLGRPGGAQPIHFCVELREKVFRKRGDFERCPQSVEEQAAKVPTERIVSHGETS